MDPNAALTRLRTLLGSPHTANVNEVAEVFEGLDEWLSKGGFTPSEWAAPATAPAVPVLYEKCRHCHLFVEENSSLSDDPYVAAFVHLHRGDAADELLDESHDADPSGMKATLSTWKMYGPEAMRERFFNTPEEN